MESLTAPSSPKIAHPFACLHVSYNDVKKDYKSIYDDDDVVVVVAVGMVALR